MKLSLEILEKRKRNNMSNQIQIPPMDKAMWVTLRELIDIAWAQADNQKWENAKEVQELNDFLHTVEIEAYEEQKKAEKDCDHLATMLEPKPNNPEEVVEVCLNCGKEMESK